VISTAGHFGVYVLAGAGNDLVCSPADDPEVQVSRGHVIQGGDGDDTLDIEGDSTDLVPGPGDDTIYVPPLGTAHEPGVSVYFDDSVPGVDIDVPDGTIDGEGHDVFTGTPYFVGTTGGPDAFTGSSGRDFFASSSPRPDAPGEPTDIIHGYGGDDVLYGFQARIFAGSGDDRVWGWDNDVHGGSGKDRIAGWQGGHLEGGDGADTIDSEFPLDEPPDISIDDFRIDGGRGSDELYLTSAYDGGYEPCSFCSSTLNGGPGTDVLSLRHTAGAIRADLALATARYGDTVTRVAHFEGIDGSAKSDVLFGNAGPNRLDGGGGADLLVGRGGHDVLTGGKGHDVADGGHGHDRCVAEVRRGC
jgi:Ca2+-binding RTX toxin-like protein